MGIVITLIKIFKEFYKKIIVIIIIEILVLAIIIISIRLAKQRRRVFYLLITLSLFIVIDSTMGLRILISSRRNSSPLYEEFREI